MNLSTKDLDAINKLIITAIGELDVKFQSKFEELDIKFQDRFEEIDDKLEDANKRIKAKDSFPAPPSNVPLPPQAIVVTHSSVSNPKWSTRSIFG